MSSTRRASKRDRLARRAENDQMRTARRDSLAVLLSRAQRGVPLTVDEANLLRAAVEAEIREGDAARQAERGQQRAADRERERVTAAEAAIVEAEERAQEAEAALDRVRALAADMRTWCSPHGIATQYADDIERALAEQPDQAVTVAPGVAVIRDRDAEQRAERAAKRTEGYRRRAEEAEQRLARIRDMADAWTRRLPAVIRTATAAEAVRRAADGDDRPVMFAVTAEQAVEQRADQAEQRAEDAEQRADQAEELQRIAHETSNAAERARAEAEQRLAAQHDAHDARRRLFADALGVDDTTTWPRLLDIARTAAHLAQRAANTEAGDTAALRLAERTARQWKARAQEAEEQAAQQCARASAWRGHAVETDDRADRHHAAWRNARKRAAERTAQRDRAEQALATAREERERALALAAARGDALAAHLAATEPTR